jgi:hypothetical protein
MVKISLIVFILLLFVGVVGGDCKKQDNYCGGVVLIIPIGQSNCSGRNVDRVIKNKKHMLMSSKIEKTGDLYQQFNLLNVYNLTRMKIR